MSKNLKAAEKAVENTTTNAVDVVKSVHPLQTVKRAKNLTRFVPNAVTRRTGRQVLKLQKHSPKILFAVGVVGVVATTVSACRATLKLESVLDELEADKQKALDVRASYGHKYSEADLKRDNAFLYVRSAVKIGKLYGPTFILGVTSIGALAGAHNILSKRNVALTAAYASIEKGFAEYRERVVGEFGEAKDAEMRYGAETKTIVEETPQGPKKVEVKRVGPHSASIYARFFDEFNQNFKSEPQLNRFFIQCQQTYASDLLHSRGHLFLNEAYDALGMPRTKEGAVVGWIMDPNDSDNFVDFGLFNHENERARAFINGDENSILLDFNVDGVIYDKI